MGIMSNLSVKLILIWTSGSREGVILRRYFLFIALEAILFSGAESIGQFWENDICEIILHLDQWVRRRCRLPRALVAILFSVAELFL